jgi:hypothetical protein
MTKRKVIYIKNPATGSNYRTVGASSGNDYGRKLYNG